jgi:hypothetical protein
MPVEDFWSKRRNKLSPFGFGRTYTIVGFEQMARLGASCSLGPARPRVSGIAWASLLRPGEYTKTAGVGVYWMTIFPGHWVRFLPGQRRRNNKCSFSLKRLAGKIVNIDGKLNEAG